MIKTRPFRYPSDQNFIKSILDDVIRLEGELERANEYIDVLERVGKRRDLVLKDYMDQLERIKHGK